MLAGRRVPSESAEEVKNFEDFSRNFEAGRMHVAKAVDIEEKNTSGQQIKMIEAAENYKQAMQFLKATQSIRIMECPERRRQEIHKMREQAEMFMRNSQERFINLTRQLGISPPAEISSSMSLPSDSRTANGSARVGGSSQQPRIARSVPPPRASSAGRRPQSATSSVNPVTFSRSGVTPPRDVLLKGVDKKFGEALLDEMLDSTGIRLADVAGADGAKVALEEAVIFPAINPALFSGLRQPVKGILLFGPPGNGKTMLAKAVATEAGQVFFNISASALTSKWVGDSEKTVRSLFQIARNAQPCIIFIDEIDSILCERSSKEADASRRLKTEFLVQFDGATSSAEERILVIGATNRPHELDDAVLRRFPKRIMLGLPDEKARSTLIKVTLRKHKADSGLSDRDIDRIASRSEGYSNSDLVALCKEAAMEPVRSIARNKLASVATATVRPINWSDFDAALRSIKPSTNDRVLREITEFARKSGSSA